jgi:hypothetical protein
MPSPFPGMDPYLEEPGIWSQFHAGLTVRIAAELNRTLPPGYLARYDRYLWIRDESEQTNVLLGESDGYVTGPQEPAAAAAQARPSTAPATLVWPVRRRAGNRFVRVVDAKRRRVVTVLEIVSPANKRGSYRRAYRRKRNEYLARGVNFVEFDFLRSGRRLPLGLPKPPSSDYYILVYRSAEPPQGGFWPLSVRDPLPPVPVPLDRGMPDTILNIRACMDCVYDESRFAEEIDYSQPPSPPLSQPEANWARELLVSKGLIRA